MAASRTILVTGGAGYVGSHTVLHFRSLGWRTITFDDLSTGHRAFAALADRFIIGDLLRPGALAEAIASERVDGIVHCAAKSLVAESIQEPLDYFDANVNGAVQLIRAASGNADPIPVVFSSSAAVYGLGPKQPLRESMIPDPINPYGFTKLAVERALLASESAHGLRSASLRYFNAAGADAECRAGERHAPETHLIPNLIAAALDPERGPAKIFGTDYNTPDGTCIRDFIHVHDVARAHEAALEYLWRGGASTVLNLGQGKGLSVRGVIDLTSELLGTPVPTVEAARRPGDPPILLADPAHADDVLGWRTTHDNRSILRSAIAWHRAELGERGT